MPCSTTARATSAFKRERIISPIRVQPSGVCRKSDVQGARVVPRGRRVPKERREPKADEDLKARRGRRARRELWARQVRLERQVRQDWCGKGPGAARPRMR